jgi:hypothetical protein
MRIDFVPFDRDDGEAKFTRHLAYGSILLEGKVIGVVAVRSVVHDEYDGERREIRLGPAKVLFAVHGADEACLRANYLDELDSLSECHEVVATGDMMRLLDLTDHERILIMDQPRTMSERGCSDPDRLLTDHTSRGTEKVMREGSAERMP